MRFLHLTLPTLEENLALDEALLLEAEGGQGGEILRLWDWSAPAVVLGAGCRLTADVDEDACREDNVPVARRASGGGTVLLAPGCLLYTLVLAYDRAPALTDVTASYAYILDRNAAALQELLPGLAHAGISDLAAEGRKVSGNAQQRKRDHLVHHGTLLYGFDAGQVARYLRPPERQPEYRQGRDHADFLGNLPAAAEDLSARLRQCWEAYIELMTWPETEVRRLVAEKYSQGFWIRRR